MGTEKPWGELKTGIRIQKLEAICNSEHYPWSLGADNMQSKNGCKLQLVLKFGRDLCHVYRFSD